MSDPKWSALQSIFDQALKLPESERDAFLINACGDDQALLGKARALLLADQSDTQIGASLLNRVMASDDALVGKNVGPWHLIKPIGAGGMGTVFLAERADGTFEQQAALKIVKKGMDSEGVVRRFEQERQILAVLDHPSIARLLDGGITDDGRPCFAMEYVDGVPITQYCDDHRLSVDDRLTLFAKVCRAVHAAHKSLIVHRDLKPSNILVTPDGVVKLLDFGIAKILNDTDNPNMTKTGLRVHTPAYAAPEQFTNGPVTTAIDIYALGGLLYELLSGLRPYDVRRPTEQVTGNQPRKPSSAITDTSEGQGGMDVEQLRTTHGMHAERLSKVLTGDLDTICLMALHTDPNRRYASANQFAADIERHLQGLPVVARADSFGYRAGKFVRRHRGILAAGIAVVAAFGLMVAHYTSQLAEERDAALDEQRKANEVVKFVTGLFEISDPTQSRGEKITARDLLDSGADSIRTELSGQPDVQLMLQRVLGEVFFSIGVFDKSRALLEDSLTRQQALLGDQNLEVANTKVSLGITIQAMGAYEDAEQLFDQGYATRLNILGSESPEVRDAIAVRAFLQETLGNYEEAETLYRDSLQISQRLEPGDSVRTALSLKELAGLHRIMDRPSEAEPLLRDALAMLNRLFGRSDPDIDDTKRQLAGLLRDTDRFDEAKTLYLEVLESRTKMLGPYHVEVGHTWSSYSTLLSRMGDPEGALQANAKLIEITERAFDGPHPSLGAAYNNRAFMLRDQGDYEGAIDNFQLSIDMQDAIDLPPRHPNRSFPTTGMAGTFNLQGRYEEAEVILRDMLDLRREAFGEEHRLVAELEYELGRALVGQDQLDEAEGLLMDAYQSNENAFGTNHSKTKNVAIQLAQLYEQRGNLEKSSYYRTVSADNDDDL